MRPDEIAHLILFQISDIFCMTELLSWEKSGKYPNELPYELSFLALFIYSYKSVSYSCAFIQLDVPSNTLLLISNKFRVLFELGIQRLETLEELEIQYSQALAKPEQETISYNRLLYNRSTYVQSNSHRILSPVSLSLQSAPKKHKFYHNFSAQNNGAHGKVIPWLGFHILQ